MIWNEETKHGRTPVNTSVRILEGISCKMSERYQWSKIPDTISLGDF